MTQEEKQLLLKDLSARFPYGVKFSFCDGHDNEVFTLSNLDGILKYDIENECTVRAYLRPMSSMTEDEKGELNERFHDVGYFFTQEPPYDYGLMVQHDSIGSIIISEFTEVYDWLNARHFDYRGLIEKGLAIEAPEDMYKIK